MGKAQSEYFSSLRGLDPETYRAQIAERVPLRRVGKPRIPLRLLRFWRPMKRHSLRARLLTSAAVRRLTSFRSSRSSECMAAAVAYRITFS